MRIHGLIAQMLVACLAPELAAAQGASPAADFQPSRRSWTNGPPPQDIPASGLQRRYNLAPRLDLVVGKPPKLGRFDASAIPKPPTAGKFKVGLALRW